MSHNFELPEIDEIGIETLDAISFAPRFNKYMYATIARHCSGKILEIGSGIGNISKHFVEDKQDISLTDLRDNYLHTLHKNFPEYSNSIFKLDIAHSEFDNRYASMFEKYDTVFALNVVEHIENDREAISNIKKLIKPGGKIIILVPAFQSLYNSFDKALEHYRRYTKKDLVALISSQFTVIHSQYFNVFGILGWFVSGQLLKKKTIPRNQMELYDNLILVSKALDKLVFNSIGLSVIAVGEK